MAKRRGLLMAGIAAGAYAYLKNPENRRKATVAFNNAKVKVNAYMESQNLEGFGETGAQDSTGGSAASAKPKSDGKSTSVQYVNEDKDQPSSKTEFNTGQSDVKTSE